MNKVLVIISDSTQGVYDVVAPKTAAIVASQSGVTDPALYAEFAESDFDSACYNFPNAFTLSGGVVGFDLAKAKELAESVINAQSNDAAREVMKSLSYDVYVAQSTLPAEQRIVKYQAAIDANNAIALETEQREQAIYAATTIEEVNAIVYPVAS